MNFAQACQRCISQSHLISSTFLQNWTKSTQVCLIQIKRHQHQEIDVKLYETDSKPKPTGADERVYRGVMTTQIKLVKVFSVSSSVMGLAVQPLLYQQISGAPIGIIIALGTFLGFFTYFTPFLLHYVTKKYVIDLIYNHDSDQYTATTLSFFARKKKVSFTVKDVSVPETPAMFTTFLAKKTPLFVDPELFIGRGHFVRIMGYDKPIDLKLSHEMEEKVENK